MAERKAVTKQMANRYRRADKTLKGQMLDELCELTSWTRRHARRELAKALSLEPPRPRKKRPKIYGEDVLEPLRMVWAALGAPAGKRLAPFMSEVVDALERHGELELREEVRTKLLKASASTIDRMLAPDRRRLRVKGRQGTKPGSILKRQIPIRTFADWDEKRPGFCETDLVAHDRGTPFGEFCQTVDLVCVATGWTEMRAIKTKAQRWVLEALLDIRQALPFPLLGLDSDNGGEFINRQLFLYCIKEEITFTRSRPNRKNDNCYIEQKNWPVVRQQVGYLRYDTPEELEVLRKMYVHLRLYMNFFQPQMKLIEKTRNGAKVSKKFDPAKTPYQRVLASPDVSEESKKGLTEIYVKLNPAQLKRDLIKCQDELIKISAEKPRKEVRPLLVNTSETFGTPRSTGTLFVRQPVGFRGHPYVRQQAPTYDLSRKYRVYLQRCEGEGAWNSLRRSPEAHGHANILVVPNVEPKTVHMEEMGCARPAQPGITGVFGVRSHVPSRKGINRERYPKRRSVASSLPAPRRAQ